MTMGGPASELVMGSLASFVGLGAGLASSWGSMLSGSASCDGIAASDDSGFEAGGVLVLESASGTREASRDASCVRWNEPFEYPSQP
jgi:hypothetical protein